MNYELWGMSYEGWGMRDEGWIMRDELWGMRDEGWGMRDEGWVRGEVVKLKYFALWRDSSLRCASFRMTGLCFLLTIRNLIIGEIVFETQRFLLLNYFLSELSWRNSFAMKRCGEGWRMKDEGWGMRGASILSQSSRRAGEMIAFLRALRNIGDVLERLRIFGWQV